MEWYGISGSWRKTNKTVQYDVEQAVSDVMAVGDGIVSGGALGVDFIATNKALELNSDASRILVILPTSLEIFTAHFFNRAVEGVIKQEQADSLIGQLTYLKNRNPASLREMHFDRCNPETYYARNAEVIKTSTRLLAFHVNNSAGVQDAIDQAKKQGKPVSVRTYTI